MDAMALLELPLLHRLCLIRSCDSRHCVHQHQKSASHNSWPEEFHGETGPRRFHGMHPSIHCGSREMAPFLARVECAQALVYLPKSLSFAGPVTLQHGLAGQVPMNMGWAAKWVTEAFICLQNIRIHHQTIEAMDKRAILFSV